MQYNLISLHSIQRVGLLCDIMIHGSNIKGTNVLTFPQDFLFSGGDKREKVDSLFLIESLRDTLVRDFCILYSSLRTYQATMEPVFLRIL